MSRKKNIDKEIEKIDKADAWNETDTIVELKGKTPLDKVVPVRLRARHWETLREIAGEMGVGPTTLARMWLLERLRTETTGYERTSADNAIKVSETKAKQGGVE